MLLMKTFLEIETHNKRLQEELKSSNDKVIKFSKDLSSKDEIFTKQDDKIIELKRVGKIIKACSALEDVD